MIGRPFARSRWAIAGLAVTAGVALALACEAPTPTSERQLITPGPATRTLTVVPLKKADEDCSPAYLLNGTEVTGRLVGSLNPDQISSVEVLKGARAMEDPENLHLDARCGIIKITTKAVQEYRQQQRAVADGPTFTPFTVRPELENKDAITKALEDSYPPLLKDAGISGAANVWLYIDDTGKVQKVQLNRTSGYPALDQAALKVAKMMKFKAALNRDKAVNVWVSIPLVFQTQ